MNRLVSLLLLFLALTGVSAKSAFNQPLLFTPERMAQVKVRMQHDATLRQGWDSIRMEADRQLSKRDLMKADFVALAYLMTDDQRYAECLKEMLLKAVSQGSWADNEMMLRKPAWRSELRMSVRCYQSAVAYAALRPLLSQKERQELSAALLQIGVEPSLGDWLLEPTRIHSLNSMGHNWWTACVYEGALLAMAISDDQPQCRPWVEEAVKALPLWFAFAGDDIQNKPRTFDRQGGMYESVNYASFGMGEALKFLVAWQDRHPKAVRPEIPQLEGIVPFFVSTCYPRRGPLYSTNFGDSHLPMAGDLPLSLLWALGHHDPDILWYIRQVQPHQHREGCYADEPMGFVFLPETQKAPREPSIAKQRMFGDMGWAVVRDSWQQDATLLAVKSGHTWNHNHADNNSFQLFYRGTQILKDCGNCTYGRDQYRQYFFQSEAHNVIKVDGEGQSSYQQYHGTMLDGRVCRLMDNGRLRYILADGTGPMSDKLSRWLRHWLWVDGIIYVVDDIHAHQQSHFEWLWHYQGKAVRRSGRLDISDGKAAVSIIPLYPQPMAPSAYLQDYPKMLYWDVRQAPTENLKGEEEYYALKLPEQTDEVKAVNAIVLRDGPADNALPRIERRQGDGWIGLRVHHKGHVTDLYINQQADGRLMHLNSWISCDGFETDAYMLAVTYAEGKTPQQAEDLFICYGSSLRHQGNVWFSSLAKLDAMMHRQGSSWQATIEGQPVFRALCFGKEYVNRK